jgi:hypothetical protein
MARCDFSAEIRVWADFVLWLILGFGVLAEESAGCDHRTHVR